MRGLAQLKNGLVFERAMRQKRIIIHDLDLLDRLIKIAELCYNPREDGITCCPLCGDLGYNDSVQGNGGMEDIWVPTGHQPTCPYSDEYKP